MGLLTIGVAGQMASGKDVLCDYLHSVLGDPAWGRSSFASNVKRIYCEAFGVDLDFVEKWKRNANPPPGFEMNVRQALTFIGDGYRKIQPNIWIDMLLKGNLKRLIISDVRYVNESTAIRNRSGINVLMWRPGYENNIDNPSEQQLMPFVRKLQGTPDGEIRDPEIPFDLWIINDGSIDNLRHKVDSIVVPFVRKYANRQDQK